ncbi:hypothetical protein GF345_00965 [Candidatus Woesearchaeota archaeon]|nr:hypothetical protein [Candidatus Woesearchaeota archaeon]
MQANNDYETPQMRHSRIRTGMVNALKDENISPEAKQMILNDQLSQVMDVIEAYNGNSKEAVKGIARGAEAAAYRLSQGMCLDLGNGHSFPMAYSMTEMNLCAEAGVRNPGGLEVITDHMKEGMVKNGMVDRIALEAGLVYEDTLPSADSMIHGYNDEFEM